MALTPAPAKGSIEQLPVALPLPSFDFRLALAAKLLIGSAGN